MEQQLLINQFTALERRLALEEERRAYHLPEQPAANHLAPVQRIGKHARRSFLARLFQARPEPVQRAEPCCCRQTSLSPSAR